ncbi:uncharacterized protein [Littorina saxatilis]|uniref:Uncharacterized protein n=1 Tax=Littorina saxatilis TaxID=31220 RepID=A0AAN9GKN2_9CAEN
MSSVGSFRIRLKSRLANKPRSPPDSAGSGTTLESPDEGDKCSTPYRLPRISPRATPCTDNTHISPDSEEKVWGRFGYEDNIRMPELGPSVHKALMNHPPTPGVCVPTVVPQGVGSRSVAAAQRYRQSVMVVPKFRNAVITPSVFANVIMDVDDASVHVYKSLLEKAAHREESLQNPAPTPTPYHNSRSVSPAKSTRSIHWALGSTKHALFDVKGRSMKQGPYSREFTVRFMAPATWMRMKWGRQRRIVH